MKIIDKIVEAIGLYDEEEEILEEEQAPKRKSVVPEDAKFEPAPKRTMFQKKENLGFFKKKEQEPEPAEEPAQIEADPVQKPEPAAEQAPKKTLFNRKQPAKAAEPSRTLALPLADKQVRVVVLEPSSFDDSQKIADYLRNNQPVVVNFENTDNIITKRMTDFVSGTIYALGGSMKKIGRSILVCAPKNVDIDAGISVYDEKGGQPWNK